MAIWTARILGPENLGFLAFGAALTGILSTTGNMGLNRLGSQKLSLLEVKEGEYIAPASILIVSVTIAQLIVGFSLAATISFVIYAIPISTPVKVSTIILSAQLVAYGFNYQWVLVAKSRINELALIHIFSRSIALVLVLAFVRSEEHLYRYAIIITSCVWLTSTLFSIYIAVTFPNLINGAKITLRNPKQLWQLMKEGFPFLSGEVLTTSLFGFDRLLLYKFCGAAQTGLYDAAKRLIIPLYSIDGIITPTFYKRLSKAYVNNVYADILPLYMSLMFIATIPFGFFTASNSRVVIQLLYGQKYISVTPILGILGFAITFGFIGGACINLFAIWEGNRIWAKAIYIASAIDIIANITLIPIFGGVGAASAMMLAKIVGFIAVYRDFRRQTKFPVLNVIMVFITISAIAASISVAVRVLSGNSYSGVITFVFSYLSLLGLCFLKWRRWLAYQAL